jgi:hypothetical protein
VVVGRRGRPGTAVLAERLLDREMSEIMDEAAGPRDAATGELRREPAGEPPNARISGPGDTGTNWLQLQERPGDPACWLRRVCPHCGGIADEDPPTTCPQCHREMPAD